MGYGDDNLTLPPEYFFDQHVVENEDLEFVYQTQIVDDLYAWAVRNGAGDYFLDVVDPQQLSFTDFLARLEQYQADTMSFGSGVFVDANVRARQINPHAAEVYLYSHDFPEFSLEIFRDLNNTDPNDPLIQFDMATRPDAQRLSEFMQDFTPSFVDRWIEVDASPNIRFTVPNFAKQFPNDKAAAVVALREYFYERIESQVQRVRFQAELEMMIQRACEQQGLDYSTPNDSEIFYYEFTVSVAELRASNNLHVYDSTTGQMYRVQLGGETYKELQAVAEHSLFEKFVLKISRLEFTQNKSYASVSAIRKLPDGSKYLSQTTYAQDSLNGEIHIEEIFDWQSDDEIFTARSIEMGQAGLVGAVYCLGGAANRGVASRALTATLPRAPMAEYNKGGIGNSRGPYAYGDGLMSATDAPIFFNPYANVKTGQTPSPSPSGWLPNSAPNMTAQGSSGLATKVNPVVNPIVASDTVPLLPSLIQNPGMTTYKFWVQTFFPIVLQSTAPVFKTPIGSAEIYILPPISQMPQTMPQPAFGIPIKINEPSHGDLMNLPSGAANEVWIWDGTGVQRERFAFMGMDPVIPTEIGDFEICFTNHVMSITVDMDAFVRGELTGTELRKRLTVKRESFSSDLKRFVAFSKEYMKEPFRDPYAAAWLHDYAQPLNVLSGYWEILTLPTWKFTVEKTIEVRGRINQLGTKDTLVYSVMINAAEAADRESKIWHQRPIAISLPEAGKQLRAANREKAVALDRILHNWLTNAARYQDAAKHNPQVAVATYKLPNGQIVLEVTDNGVGFLNGSVSRIGELGLQEGRVSIAESSGTGLFSVIDLAKSNGWGIAIRTVEGQGTTWRLTLPAADVHDQGQKLTTRAPDETDFRVIVPVR